MLDEEVTWTSDKLHNIYFDGDETLIVVESESLFTHSYAIEEIKKIYFATDESFAEFDIKNETFVYPNPAKDNVRLIGVENQEVEIFSIDGKSFLKVNYDGRSLDVSNLPQGTITVKQGGTISGGENFYGYYTDATYTGETSSKSVTISGMVTTYGNGGGGPF